MTTNLPDSPIRKLPNYLPSLEHHHVAQASASGIIPQFQAAEGENQLREYLRVVYKHRLLVAAIAAIVTCGAIVYSLLVTPTYEANAKIKIGTYSPVLSATRIEDLLQEKSKESNYLETQLEELTSLSLADRVLQDPEVREIVNSKTKSSWTSEKKNNETDGSEPDDSQINVDAGSGYHTSLKELKKYLNTIAVKPVRRTSIVLVTAKSANPSYAALLANKHAQAYIEWVRASRIEQQAQGLSFLRAQADELREKVADLERELADYAETNSIVALNKDENITVQKMAQMNQLLTSVTAKKIEAEKLYQEAQSSLKSPSAGFDDDSAQHLRSELAKLEGEYSELSQKFTASYPKMKQLSSQIAEMKAGLERQRAQIVLGLKARASAAAEEEAKLKDELEQQKSQAFELSKRQVQYNVLNRDLTSSRELLQNVLKQIKETSLAVESNASNVSIVDRAAVPNSPAAPRKKLIAICGLIAGLIIGFSVAFFLNYLDNTVRTPEDVINQLQVPSLGVVPSFALEEEQIEGKRTEIGMETGQSRPAESSSNSLVPLGSAGGAVPLAYVSSPKSLVAEAYRSIRTALLLSQAGEPPKTILVTSAHSAEGKTTSSMNLAACLASSGGKVVLIDADLRRPSVLKYFGINPVGQPGLVEVLAGVATVDEATHTGSIPNLYIIGCGQTPPNPAELLSSIQMAQVLDSLATKFDYVIVDSPPILPVTDSVILSRYVDGVVIVVKGGTTPRKVVRDARERLSAVGARILGVILNDVDIAGGDYYYYNHYYYYSYHGSESPSGSKRHQRRKAV